MWRGSKNEKPYMVRPDGTRIELEVRDYVPYLCSKSHQSNFSLAATKPEVLKQFYKVRVVASSSREVEVPNSEDEPFSPPDDVEYEDDEPAIVGGNVPSSQESPSFCQSFLVELRANQAS